MGLTMGHWRPIGNGEWVGTDASARFPVYTRGNAGEVYPNVFTPLSFSTTSAAGEQAMRNAILSTGVIRPKELEGVPLTTAIGSGVFGGYAYLNLSLQRVATGRLPGGSSNDADANYLGVGDTPNHVPSRLDRNWRASMASVRYALRTLKTTDLPQLAIDQRRVDDYLASLADPADATDEELVEASRSQLHDLFMELFETHLEVSSAAGGMMTVLIGICEKQVGDTSVVVRLVSGLGGVDSAAPSVALWKLGRVVRSSASLTAEFEAGVPGLLDRITASADAESNETAAESTFLQGFSAFIEEFGSRGPNEWDTAFDTWETDPALALVLVDRMRGADDDHDPVAQQSRLAHERDALEADILQRLKWPTKFMFRKALAATRFYSQSRERTKTTVVRAIHGSRLRAQELDHRLTERSGGQRGDLWFLLAEEIDAYVADPTSFASAIAERRDMHRQLAERIPPFSFDTALPPLDEWEMRHTPLESVVVGEVITGLPGCAGIARGRARIIIDPSDPRDLAAGDVLIAPLTDPSWTPLFVPAEAVVVDVGAVMSHAVIVSRELGIPCAVSVQNATRRIPDGALVEVDGGAGTVTILEL